MYSDSWVILRAQLCSVLKINATQGPMGVLSSLVRTWGGAGRVATGLELVRKPG